MMPHLARWLKKSRQDLTLVGFDANPQVARAGVAGFAKVHTLPQPSHDKYVKELTRAIEVIGPCTLVPGSDEEAHVLAHAKGEITAAGGRIAISSPEDLAIVGNKLKLAEQLTAGSDNSQVPVMPAYDPVQARQAVAKLGGPEHPVVLKPSSGRGRRGVFIISETPLPAHDDLPPVIGVKNIDGLYQGTDRPDMAMPYIAGQAVTVDLLANSGTAVQIVVRKWLENWRFPFPGQLVCRDPAIERMARQIARRFNLHGLVDIDLISPRDGTAAILEVNPRPSGSSVVAIAAGIPLFTSYAKIAAGEAPEPVYVRDCTVRREDLEFANG